MNSLSDSLSLAHYEKMEFSKLDTNKGNSVMFFYMPKRENVYWMSFKYKSKNISHYILFGIDTSLKTIDTMIKRD